MVREVEYVRMSAKHPQYSTENQRDRIRDYPTKLRENDPIAVYICGSVSLI
jgi:hypothetical protein